MRELLWIDELWEDVVSDFSAIHRVDDPLSLPSPRFFSLAQRLPAYPGAVQAAMRVRIMDTQRQLQPEAAGAPMTEDVAAVAALSQRGGGEFPGIEYVGG